MEKQKKKIVASCKLRITSRGRPCVCPKRDKKNQRQEMCVVENKKYIIKKKDFCLFYRIS